VVALVVAIGQATYAFPPAAFGFIRELSAGEGAYVFATAAAVYALAIGALLIGRYAATKSARA
jgi:transcriptional regulator GlxA family with amidase domain